MYHHPHSGPYRRILLTFGLPLGGAALMIMFGYGYLPVPLAKLGPVLSILWLGAIGGVAGLFLKGMFEER